MWRAFRSLVGAVVIAGASAPAVAQVNVQPTPAPVVTADDRPWFRARDPIVFDGSLYYPTGAQIFFNRFDMIRSGYCDWVPLYIRTTLEPFSVLFVPVAGGLMQPYRASSIAGARDRWHPIAAVPRRRARVDRRTDAGRLALRLLCRQTSGRD